MPNQNENPKSKRKLRNYLLEPEIQLKRAYYFLAFFFCMLGGMFFWAWIQVVIAVEFLDAKAWLVAVRLTDLLEAISPLTLFLYLATGIVFSVLFGVYSSHRVIGPSVAIKHHLNRLKAGDFSKRLHIRKGDELVTVAREINELTDELRKKSDSSEGA